MDSPGNTGKRLVLVLVCLAGLGVNCFIYLPFLSYRPNNDFLGLYPGGRLAGSDQIYDPERVLAEERRAAGVSNEQRLFIRPPYYAALLWPLARLPYRTAFYAYQASLLGCVGVFVLLWRIPDRAKWVLSACFWSTPLFASFVIGQDIPLLLASVALSFALLRRERNVLAGLALSPCAIKPHLFILVPVVLAAKRLYGMTAGLAMGGAVLLALCFAGGGPNGIAAFLRTSTLPQVSPDVRAMPNFRGVFGDAWQAEAACGIGVAILIWYVARRSSYRWSFAAATAGGLLVGHHAYLSDCAALLPAVLICLAEAQKAPQRALAWALLTPVVYLPIYLGGAAAVTRAFLILFAVSFAFVPRGGEVGDGQWLSQFSRASR